MVGRYISFISPWSAFLILGIVVVGIMLQVSTIETYTETARIEFDLPISDRYFLFEPAQFGGKGIAFTQIQIVSLLIGLALISFTVAARLMDSEVETRRMGLFQYLFIASLLLALFIAILIQPDFWFVGG